MPTYRRPDTLPRSIQSLINQTFTNWVCEVHNDAPDDIFPADYVESLNDPRFVYIAHPKNLGPVATFNLMFEATTHSYICLLEDDNWWEPDFLQEMTNAIDTHPECTIGFSNSNLWEEKTGNRWLKKAEPLWPVNADELYSFIKFPQVKHVFNYHHSNCSMMIKNTGMLQEFIVPENIRIDFIEPIRERAFPHPMLMLNKPLANFALTINTSRANTITGIHEHYLLLIDSFFSCVKLTDDYAKKLWADARSGSVKSFNKLIYTGIICKASRKLLGYARLSEWIYFILYNIKHPGIFIKCLKAKTTYKQLWHYLLLNTHKQINRYTQ